MNTDCQKLRNKIAARFTRGQIQGMINRTLWAQKQLALKAGPELRGQGYGRKALALLGKGGKPVILEIDPPVDRASMNRKCFYEGCGYKAAPFAHVHPPYHRNTPGHELVVMSAPGPLSREAYESFRAYLENTVMKDPFAEESVTSRS